MIKKLSLHCGIEKLFDYHLKKIVIIPSLILKLYNEPQSCRYIIELKLDFLCFSFWIDIDIKRANP